MVKIYKNDIERQTKKNHYYRKILFTSKQMQLVLMSISPYDQIGEEVHKKVSQFFRVEKGSGYAVIAGKRYRLKNGDAVLVPSGTKHNIIAGKSGLQLYTIYSPPEHPKNLRQKYNPRNE